MAYAEGTAVPVEKTVAEIVGMIRRNEGAQIAQLDEDQRYIIAFTMGSRQVRFTVGFESVDDERIRWRKTNGAARTLRTAAQIREAWEGHRRQRMRALMLVIKAKLESVASGVETFEQAFLANVVTSNGRTVHERISDDLAIEYQQGCVRPLMIGGPQ